MADDDTPSIFDIFGEPPEVDPNRFGPVPVDSRRSTPSNTRGERATSPLVGTTDRPGAPGDPEPDDPEPEVWSDLSGPTVARGEHRLGR